MRPFTVLVIPTLLLAVDTQAGPAPIRGFSVEAAATQRNWEEAGREIDRIAERLTAAAELIRRAAAML